MIHYCQMETLVLTWTLSTPLSLTSTSRVSWEQGNEGWDRTREVLLAVWPSSSCVQAATCWLPSFWSPEADD